MYVYLCKMKNSALEKRNKPFLSVVILRNFCEFENKSDTFLEAASRRQSWVMELQALHLSLSSALQYIVKLNISYANKNLMASGGP